MASAIKRMRGYFIRKKNRLTSSIAAFALVQHRQRARLAKRFMVQLQHHRRALLEQRATSKEKSAGHKSHLKSHLPLPNRIGAKLCRNLAKKNSTLGSTLSSNRHVHRLATGQCHSHWTVVSGLSGPPQIHFKKKSVSEKSRALEIHVWKSSSSSVHGAEETTTTTMHGVEETTTTTATVVKFQSRN
jgi:hypothetical protein